MESRPLRRPISIRSIVEDIEPLLTQKLGIQVEVRVIKLGNGDLRESDLYLCANDLSVNS